MKILYNVTVSIAEQVETDWKNWMLQTHIPDVMSTGKFLNYSMQKVIDVENEMGVTYAIQYIAPDRETYDKYQQEDAPRLQQDHQQRYNGYFGAFRTLMEIISHS